MLLSIIVPCFNEEAAIPYFYDEMSKVLESMVGKWEDLEAEFVFVDDGSKDNGEDASKEETE